MSGRLDGKVAVVTGGASGIGAAVAARFGLEGAIVTALDLADGDGTVPVVRCDVTDQAAVDAAFAAIAAEHGRIDVVVNSAGIAHIGTVASTTDADLDRVYAVNVKGVYHCLRAAVAHMEGTGGSIVNLASVASTVGIPDRFAYSMSKGAVLAMTLSVATDYLAAGIRCNAIAPARVHTPFVDRYLADTYPDREAEMFEALSKTQPIGRMGRPDEIASLAVYLASDESGFVTGANLAIDGGFVGIRP